MERYPDPCRRSGDVLHQDEFALDLPDQFLDQGGADAVALRRRLGHALAAVQAADAGIRDGQHHGVVTPLQGDRDLTAVAPLEAVLDRVGHQFVGDQPKRHRHVNVAVQCIGFDGQLDLTRVLAETRHDAPA